MHPHVGPQYVWCLTASAKSENTHHPKHVTALFLPRTGSHLHAVAAARPPRRRQGARSGPYNPTPPPWGSTRFVWPSARARHWGARVVSLTKSSQHTHLEHITARLGGQVLDVDLDEDPLATKDYAKYVLHGAVY